MNFRKLCMIAVALFASAWLGLQSASAQTLFQLSSSGQIVDFVTGSSPGSLSVILAWAPVFTSPGELALTGSAVAPSLIGGDPNFSLTTPGPIALAAMGQGTYAASASSLQTSTLTASADSGAALFVGDLTSLSFSQPIQGSNWVSFEARAQGLGPFAATTLNVIGQIALAAGSNINAVAYSGVATDVGGVVVPEPATLLLLGTGLLLLLAMVRCRPRFV